MSKLTLPFRNQQSSHKGLLKLPNVVAHSQGQPFFSTQAQSWPSQLAIKVKKRDFGVCSCLLDLFVFVSPFVVVKAQLFD